MNSYEFCYLLHVLKSFGWEKASCLGDKRILARNTSSFQSSCHTRSKTTPQLWIPWTYKVSFSGKERHQDLQGCTKTTACQTTCHNDDVESMHLPTRSFFSSIVLALACSIPILRWNQIHHEPPARSHGYLLDGWKAMRWGTDTPRSRETPRDLPYATMSCDSIHLNNAKTPFARTWQPRPQPTRQRASSRVVLCTIRNKTLAFCSHVFRECVRTLEQHCKLDQVLHQPCCWLFGQTSVRQEIEALRGETMHCKANQKPQKNEL